MAELDLPVYTGLLLLQTHVELRCQVEPPFSWLSTPTSATNPLFWSQYVHLCLQTRQKIVMVSFDRAWHFLELPFLWYMCTLLVVGLWTSRCPVLFSELQGLMLALSRALFISVRNCWSRQSYIESYYKSLFIIIKTTQICWYSIDATESSSHNSYSSYILTQQL